MKLRLLSLIPAIALMFMGAVALSPQKASADSIAEIAVATDDLSTLVELVSAVGLVDTLAGEGTFTVFAPTNEAFGKLPQRVLDILGERPDILETIILYHVLGEEKFATAVLADNRHTTLQGESVRVRSNDNSAFVNRSEITTIDIDADNGVVHLIDRVLLPNEAKRELLREIINQFRNRSNH